MLFGVLAHVITRRGLAADRKVLAVSSFPPGFHREGTLRRAAAEPDGLHDQAVCSLLNDEI